MLISPYQAKYYTYQLTKRCPSDTPEKLSAILSNAQVDLNPHQIDAALFAFKSPLSKAAILADEDRTYFLTTLHIHPESQVSEQVVGPVRGPVRGPVELTDIQYKILLECSTNPLSAKEITGKIGLTIKSGNVKRALAILRKNEYLSYTIPEKPGSRLQKYRITEKGLKIINEARQQ